MDWKLNKDWFDKLKPEFSKDYFRWLYKYLKVKYIAKEEIYPKENEIFNALNYTPLDKVKVVIIGQDPYHSENTAHGLSFSTNNGKIPPSLRNVFKEIINEYGASYTCNNPANGSLVRWAEQGVLLLNRTLTVEKGKPNSHEKIGWKTFTEEIIQILNRQDKPIVYLLWGNNAKTLKRFITNEKQYVLESAHPSPLSASRGFFGNDHFYKCNCYLKDNNVAEIEW